MAVNYSEISDTVETSARPRAAERRPSPGIAPWRVYHIGFGAPGRVELFHYDEEGLPENCFRVRTLYCAA